MIKNVNYEIVFYYNDKEIPIANDIFSGFKIVEDLKYLVCFYILYLSSSIFLMGINFICGEKIKFRIRYFLENGEESFFEKDVYIYNYVIKNNIIELMLVDDIVLNFFNKKDMVYDGNIVDVIKKVGKELGIKKFDIDNFLLSSRYFYKIDIDYFKFFRSLCYEVKGAYIFYDRFGVLKMSNFEFFKNKNVKFNLTNLYNEDIIIENRIFENSVYSNCNANVYFFDWESGKMKNKKYDIHNDSKSVGKIFYDFKNRYNFSSYTGMISKENKIMEDYLVNICASDIIYKNSLRLFININIGGGFFNDLSVGDKIKLAITNVYGNSVNTLLSGEYLLYSYVIKLMSDKVYHNFVLLSPFLFDKVSFYS